MTARYSAVPRSASAAPVRYAEDHAEDSDGDPLRAAADPLETARAHITDAALRDTPPDRRLVGLELEFHLVDLSTPAARPSWEAIQALVGALPPMPSGSAVTVEPGGQLELSTPPTVGVADSVAALRADRIALSAGLAAAGYGTAPLGTDPARPALRVNPSGRYAAMEAHFAALGCAGAGAAMMTSTAALQVNLDAGPSSGWTHRLGLLHDLGPVLVAASACSPLLGGHASGWRSMRQQAWHGIDLRRTAALPDSAPAEAWASYALAAPVMLVPGDDEHPDATAVTERVPLADWLRGRDPFHRRPTLRDVDYHLTTLFPPVRPRGYVELRCLDAMPDRWWPALAGATVALVDNAVAADEAAEVCEPVRGRWRAAARDGLADVHVRRAAEACLDIAARHCAPELKADVESYAELVASGRTPGDELRERAAATDPLTVLEEEAHV